MASAQSKPSPGRSFGPAAVLGGLLVTLSVGSVVVSAHGGACGDQVGPALAGRGGPSGPAGGGPPVAGVLAGAVPAGAALFADAFDRAEIGPDWVAPEGGPWRIEDGALHVQNAQNKALWLARPLPDEVIVEFDAWSTSADGDVKCEIFGDGAKHESGYSLIFGGWTNTITTIARLGEHEPGRVEMRDAMTVGKHYHWKIVRAAAEIELYVDGALKIARHDPEMLRGPGHDRFAFNDWASDSHYDDVKVYAARLGTPSPGTAAPASGGPVPATGDLGPTESPGAPY